MRFSGFLFLVLGALLSGFFALASTESKANAASEADTHATGNRPVVAELFTSQGCSSCPPADAVAAKLAQNPNIIVVSRPVTYWDRLGWKDTLAKEENTTLQQRYAYKGFAKAGVYTPQIVIDGSAAEVGSREARVRSLIKKAQQRPALADIDVTTDAEGNIIVNVSGESKIDAKVSLLALSREEIVSVGRGENNGRKLRYTNVLKYESTLGRWDNGPKSFMIEPAAVNIPGADCYAVIVREGQAGPILAAEYIS